MNYWQQLIINLLKHILKEITNLNKNFYNFCFVTQIWPLLTEVCPL